MSAIGSSWPNGWQTVADQYPASLRATMARTTRVSGWNRRTCKSAGAGAAGCCEHAIEMVKGALSLESSLPGRQQDLNRPPSPARH
jgi:hypothetical protein